MPTQFSASVAAVLRVPPRISQDSWACRGRSGKLTTPTMRHLPVDKLGHPRPEKHEDWNGAHRKPLKTVVYDDGFEQRAPTALVFHPPPEADRRLDVKFEKGGYPAASALRTEQTTTSSGSSR